LEHLFACRVTSPLLLVAVVLSAGAAYAALLKYSETRLIVAGTFTNNYFYQQASVFVTQTAGAGLNLADGTLSFTCALFSLRVQIYLLDACMGPIFKAHIGPIDF